MLSRIFFFLSLPFVAQAAPLLSGHRWGIPRGGSLQARRWERMDGKALSGGQQQQQPSLRNSLQSAAGGRACSLYVWDAPSALLHKWCHHLLRDSVFEGMGGRKFVRIEPGSILQLLYPCSRYSPDRCIVCGGTFQNHLTLWWAKHLYTPFDKSIDKTYASGVVLEPKFPNLPSPLRKPNSRSTSNAYSNRRRTATRTTSTRRRSTTRSSRSPKSSSTKIAPPEMIKTFSFHRNYVTDLESLAPGVTDPKERTRKLRRELQKLQKSQGGSPMELRMLPTGDKKVAYVVPRPPKTDKQQSFTSRFVRFAALNAVDRLIGMQETENANIRARARTGGCCN